MLKIKNITKKTMVEVVFTDGNKDYITTVEVDGLTIKTNSSNLLNVIEVSQLNEIDKMLKNIGQWL